MGLLDKVKKFFKRKKEPAPAPRPRPTTPIPDFGPINRPTPVPAPAPPPPRPEASFPADAPLRSRVPQPEPERNVPTFGPVTGPSRRFRESNRVDSPVPTAPVEPTVPVEPEKTGFVNRLDAALTPNRDYLDVPLNAASPFALIGPGKLSKIGQKAISFFKKPTKINELSKVGKTGLQNLRDKILNAEKLSAADTIATNTVSSKKTLSMLQKAAIATGVSIGSVHLLVEALGTYPFSQFNEAEAINTLNYGYSSAVRNGDLDGAQNSITQVEEILNPTFFDTLKSYIPWVNAVDSLDKFRDAAAVSTEINQKILDDMRIQQETGETDDQRWARVNEERAQQERESIDYYNQERQRLVEWELDAKRQQRNEDAKFWAKEKERQSKLEAADREATAKFWYEYRKRMQELADNSRPSNLKFGLL